MLSNNDVWLWYSDACIVCDGTITSSKVPIQLADSSKMLNELSYYMRRHVETKHKNLKLFAYNPSRAVLHPAGVRQRMENR